MPRYEIDATAFGPVLKLRGPWRKSYESFVQTKGISQLQLFYSEGWRGSDLEFLKTVPHLNGLYVWDQSGLDVSGIRFLVNLRRLKVMIWKLPSSPVPFERFPNLESCDMEWNPALQSVIRCGSLKRLAISDMREVPSLDLTALRCLQAFWLTRAFGLQEIKLPLDNNLVEAALRRIPSLRSVVSWSSASHLARLWLTDCKKLDVPSLGDAIALRELDLFDMGRIKSLRFIERLCSLERLRLSGSTEVEDGGLAFITRLPKMKALTFPPKTHYDLTAQEAQHILARR